MLIVVKWQRLIAQLSPRRDARAESERIDVAFARYSDRSDNREKFPFLRPPHARRNHDPRKIVATFDDKSNGGVVWFVGRGVVKIGDYASESEHEAHNA